MSALPRGEAERFWSKVSPEPTSGCMLWTACVNQFGYGLFRRATGQMIAAHRRAYEFERGPIPDGLVIDHLCRVRSCVNPAHLEVVTQRENMSRGIAPAWLAYHRGTCAKGHLLDGLRTDGRRFCRACRDYRYAVVARAGEAVDLRLKKSLQNDADDLEAFARHLQERDSHTKAVTP